MSLKQHWARIGLLLAIAGALLGWLSAHTEILFADGLRYIGQAQSLEQGSWSDGLLKAVDHPVYPLEIVAARRWFAGDSPEAWQAAAQAASIAAALLLIIPVYLVAWELFGESTAWIAGLLTYAVPLTSHVFADALSESTFLLFWTWGLWTALRFLRQGNPGWLAPTIGCAALAYLTRPEGILLPAALITTLGVVPFTSALRLDRVRWWTAVGVLVIGPALLIGPYIAIKGGIGTKPSIQRILGTTARSAPEAVERQRPLEPDQTTAETYAESAKAVFEATRDAITIPLLPLAVIGLFAGRSSRMTARGWLFLTIILLASVLALWRLHATGGYCTPRHALIIALVLIAAAAAGMKPTIEFLVATACRLPRQVRRTVKPVVWSLLVVGLGADLVPRSLTPINAGLGGYRAAAAWLKSNVPADVRVVDVTGWVLFYSNRQGYTFADLVNARSDQSARWVVAREAHLKGPWPYCAELRDLVGEAQPVAVFRGANRRQPTRIYLFDRRQSGTTTTQSVPGSETIRR